MRKIVIILLSAAFFTSCLPNLEVQTSEKTTQPIIVTDIGGNKIKSSNVSEITLDYAFGRTIENREYRKISHGDKVAGLEVIAPGSLYYHTSGDDNGFVLSRSRYSIGYATLKGIVRLEHTYAFIPDFFAEINLDDYVPVFYRYYEKESAYFPVITRIDDYTIKRYEDVTKIKSSDGTKVMIDPVPIYLEGYAEKVLFDLSLNEIKETTLVFQRINFFTQSQTADESGVMRAKGIFSEYLGEKTL